MNIYKLEIELLRIDDQGNLQTHYWHTDHYTSKSKALKQVAQELDILKTVWEQDIIAHSIEHLKNYWDSLVFRAYYNLSREGLKIGENKWKIAVMKIYKISVK